MKVEDIQNIDLAVKRCREHIDAITKMPAEAYQAALTVFLKVLNTHNLNIPIEDMERVMVYTNNYPDHEKAIGEMPDSMRVNKLVAGLLETLKNGTAWLPADALKELEKYVIQENTRTSGIIVDNNPSTERYSLDMRGPKVDLTSAVLELADKLRTHNWHIDERAWKQLVCFIPGYRALKKAKKKLDKLKKLIG